MSKKDKHKSKVGIDFGIGNLGIGGLFNGIEN